MRRIVIVVAVSMLCLGVSRAQWVLQPVGWPQDAWVGRVFPVDDLTVWFASPYHEGYGRTTDGGGTWETSFVPGVPADYFVSDIFALDANTAWVGFATTSGGRSGYVFKTTDGGSTWTHQTSAFGTTGGFMNIIHFFDADNGLCAGDALPNDNFEIYTTTDGGDNWVRVPSTQMPPSAGESFVYGADGTYGDCLWFKTDRGKVMRTTDRGQTWSSVYVWGPGSYYSLADLVFVDSLNGLLLDTDLFRTSDGGITWSGLPIPEWIEMRVSAFDLTYATTVPGKPNTVVWSAIGTDGLGEPTPVTAISTDLGDTWMRMDLVGGYYPVFSSANVGWMGGPGGVYKWEYTGKHIWRCAPSNRFAGEADGVSAAATVCLGNYGTEPLTVSALIFESGNYTVVNPPTTPFVLQPWEPIHVSVAFSRSERGEFEDSLTIVSDATNAPALGVTFSGKGFQFGDTPVGTEMYSVGDSLFKIDVGSAASTSIGTLGIGQIDDLAVNPVSQTLYGMASTSRLWILYRIDPVSLDGLRAVSVLYGEICAIAFSPVGTLFGVTQTGTLLKIDPETGQTTEVGSSSGIIYASLAFSGDGTLYASVRPPLANKDAIYTVDTTDGSTTLVGKTGDNAPTPSIAFNSSGELFGLKGFGTQVNSVIRIDPATGAGTVIGSTGKTGLRAITMINIPVSVEEQLAEGLPMEFHLAQNYPNPFNPGTAIEFVLPQKSHVSLKVYNLLGQEVMTLLDDERTAGVHKVEFNAGRLASGVYIYRIQAGEYVAARKLILLR